MSNRIILKLFIYFIFLLSISIEANQSVLDILVLPFAQYKFNYDENGHSIEDQSIPFDTDELFGFSTVSDPVIFSVHIPGMQVFPRGKRGKNALKPHKDYQKKMSEPEAEKADSQPLKSLHEICVDYFNDRDNDGGTTLNQRDWLHGALSSFERQLTKFLPSIRQSKTESFLATLAENTWKTLRSDEARPLGIHSEEFHDLYRCMDLTQSEGRYMSFLYDLAFSCNWVYEQDIANSMQSRTRLQFDHHQFDLFRSRHSKKNFPIKAPTSEGSDYDARINGLLELLCLTSDPVFQSYEARWFLPLLLDLGVIINRGGSYIINQNFGPDAHGQQGISFVTSDYLVRDMIDYYTTQRHVTSIKSALSQVIFPKDPLKARSLKKTTVSAELPGARSSESASQPSRTAQATRVCSSKCTDSPPVTAKPLKAGNAAAGEATTPLASLYSSEPKPDFNFQFRRALWQKQVDRAIDIYRNNRAVIEGHKSWEKTMKERFWKVLVANEKFGIIKKFNLNPKES